MVAYKRRLVMKQNLYNLLSLVTLTYGLASRASSEIILETRRIAGPDVVTEYDKATMTCSFKNTDYDDAVDWILPKAFSTEQAQFTNIAATSNTLVIRNVSINHAGHYHCCQKTNERVCASKHLSVISFKSRGLPMLASTIGNSTGILVVAGRDLTIKWNYNSAGSVHWTVTKELDKLFCSSKQRAHICSHHTLGNYFRSLGIQNLHLKDSGWFTVTLKINTTEIRYRLNVMFQGQPTELRMDDVSVLRGNHSVEVTCQGLAYPVPEFTFAFTPCPSLEWNECRTKQLDESTTSLNMVSNTTPRNDTANARITVTFEQPPYPGIVRCTAINLLGSTTVESLLFLRNFNENVQLEKVSPPGVVYTNDKIHVRCRLDVYDFLDDITINYNHQRVEPLKIPHKDGMYFTQADYIVSAPDNVMHDHVVECEGQYRNGTLLSKRLDIPIRQSVKPYIFGGSEFQDVTTQQEESLQLDCNITGDPVPTITWFENEKPVIHQVSTLHINVTPTESPTRYKCIARNRFGEMFQIWDVNLANDPTDRSESVLFVVIVTLILIGGSGGLVCVVLLLKRPKAISDPSEFLMVTNGNDGFYLKENLIPPEYEFPRSSLTLGHLIGQGQFGMVQVGTAHNILVSEEITTVAVKTMKRGKNCEMKAFIEELKTLINIGQHLNVVNFLGVVTRDVEKEGIMIILEYCSYGCLQNYLRKNRLNFDTTQSWECVINQLGAGEKSAQACTTTSNTITLNDLICWAAQVANGMAYLADKNVVHGDLATRNVLLCNDNVVKIGDFGLAQVVATPGQSFRRKNDSPLPFRWLALESISGHVFSTKTDVWAYGVTLWEMFSLGAIPYTGMADKHMFAIIRDGYRLEKPTHANDDIYELMISCWYVNPDLRPSFRQLASKFNSMLPVELQNYYISLNEMYLQPYTFLQTCNEAFVSAYSALEQPKNPPPPPVDRARGSIRSSVNLSINSCSDVFEEKYKTVKDEAKGIIY